MKLRAQQKSRDAGVRLELPRDGANQVALRLADLFLGETAVTHVRDLLIDRRQRALDVLARDARANHQRSFREARVKAAVDVVRHPLLLANAVAETAAQRILTEGVIHHPCGVVIRIGAADANQPIGDIDLRLVHHRRDGQVALGVRSHGGTAARTRTGLTPPAEGSRRGVHDFFRVDVADNDDRRPFRREPHAMKLHEIVRA